MSLTLTSKRLDEIAVISAGDPAPQKAEEFASDGMPFVRMQDVGKHGHTTSLVESKDRVSADTSARLKTFAAGSILIPKSGVSIRLNHRAILGIDAHVVSHLAVIQVRPGVNPKFVYYWLCGVDMAKVAHDAHMPSLKLGDLGALTIALPPLPEQDRIVKILGAADELRKLRRQADRRTADLIPAIFHDMFGDPATNTKGWPTSALGDTVASIRYGLGQPPEESADGVPFIRATNIKHGRIESGGLMRVRRDKVSESKKPFLAIGEVLVVRSGAYTGDVAIVDKQWCGSVAGYDLVITPGKEVAGEFLTWYLLTQLVQTNHFASLKQRAAQPHLNSQQLGETPFFLPPLGFQKEFAGRVAKVREMEAKQAESRRRLDDLFQSLLHRAFEGEL